MGNPIFFQPLPIFTFLKMYSFDFLYYYTVTPR
nr:MAG TPA: hypothetical protein [Caudoviricetes sp.]